MISYDPLLQAEVARLTAAKTKAWDDLFAAERAACPPALESLLWKVAKSGYTKEVAPFMNLSKATRGCKNLQRYMRKVRNWGEYGSGGMTQLHFYCRKGITSSVMRFLNMRSIDLDANLSHEAQGWACLISAVYNGHLDICRLLIDKGAQIEGKTRFDMTPLHFAASQGRIEIVKFLCDRGANVEAKKDDGSRPLHDAAYSYHISTVKELIEVRNLDINARDNGGWTALSWARRYHKPEISAYLISHGGIE